MPTNKSTLDRRVLCSSDTKISSTFNEATTNQFQAADALIFNYLPGEWNATGGKRGGPQFVTSKGSHCKLVFFGHVLEVPANMMEAHKADEYRMSRTLVRIGEGGSEEFFFLAQGTVGELEQLGDKENKEQHYGFAVANQLEVAANEEAANMQVRFISEVLADPYEEEGLKTFLSGALPKLDFLPARYKLIVAYSLLRAAKGSVLTFRVPVYPPIVEHSDCSEVGSSSEEENEAAPSKGNLELKRLAPFNAEPHTGGVTKKRKAETEGVYCHEETLLAILESFDSHSCADRKLFVECLAELTQVMKAERESHENQLRDMMERHRTVTVDLVEVLRATLEGRIAPSPDVLANLTRLTGLPAEHQSSGREEKV